jgi:hypothetical protein
VTDIDRLLAEYIAEHRAGGEADPNAYLARASPEDRVELAALIDAVLARSPRRVVDPDAFRGSPSEQTVDELERSLDGVSGLWPALLPHLRARAGLKRNDLVNRLAALLDQTHKAPKVASYYHQMEQGLLPSAGVSDRVVQGLGQILGQPAEALRQAGRALGERASGAAEPPTAFARSAISDEPIADASTSATGATAAPDWDEVDELFRGG